MRKRFVPTQAPTITAKTDPSGPNSDEGMLPNHQGSKGAATKRLLPGALLFLGQNPLVVVYRWMSLGSLAEQVPPFDAYQPSGPDFET